VRKSKEIETFSIILIEQFVILFYLDLNKKLIDKKVTVKKYLKN
jgi:hypothetical protein